MSDEWSYLEELKTLIVTLAHTRADDPNATEPELEDCCNYLAGGDREFEEALDEQRQQVSDAVLAKATKAAKR